MAILTNAIGAITSYLWGNTHSPSLPQKNTIGESFRATLSSVSDGSISQEECVANCCKIVKELLELDCDLSMQSQQDIGHYLTQFEKEADEARHLDIYEIAELKAAFKEGLKNIVLNQWTSRMANAFHSVVNNSEKEAVVSLQKWTSQFFEGVVYFNQWESEPSIIEVVEKLQKRTSLAFRQCSYEGKQKKAEAMSARMEKDPKGFALKLEKAVEKAEKNPMRLTAEDKELLEFVNIAAGSVVGWPDIDISMELLKKCVAHGLTLHQKKQSFFNDAARQLFEGLVKKTQTDQPH